MQALTSQTQTVFAELTERVAAREAARSIAQLAGSFASKKVRGHIYWYFRASTPGSGQIEHYLGPDSPSLRRLIDAHRAGRRADAPEARDIRHLCGLLKAGGANTLDHTAARVLEALADAGMFHLGAVLVGTYAYLVLGNVLGIRWASGLRTQDIDVAAASGGLTVVVPPLEADIPSTLEALAMGFLPVPQFDPRAPSTSFKVRGRELRVDFLTPAAGRRRTAPVSIPRLHLAATPLEMLDYLIEGAVRTVAINSGAVAVNVPDPARLALHKLVIADRRPLTAQPKAVKDREQALALLGVLEEQRPRDLTTAIRAARARYSAFHVRLQRAVQALPDSPAAAALKRRLRPRRA